jgi:hypothetical protein
MCRKELPDRRALEAHLVEQYGNQDVCTRFERQGSLWNTLQLRYSLASPPLPFLAIVLPSYVASRQRL